MNRRGVILASALPLGALLVAACSQGDGGGQQPPPEATELTVGTETGAVHEFTLRSGGTEYFTVPTAGLDGEFDHLMVIEVRPATPGIRLDLTDGTGGAVIATSSGPDSFASPSGAQPASTLTSGGLEPEAIRAGVSPCEGPCVVLRPTGAPEQFEVTNASGVAEELSIFVYPSLFVDTFEPRNDDSVTPSLYNIGETGEGALETLGDVDWWQVASLEQVNDTIELVHTGGLDLMLFVVTDIGTFEYEPGDPAYIEVGGLLRVESISGRAARGAPSHYVLQPVPGVASGGARR